MFNIIKYNLANLNNRQLIFYDYFSFRLVKTKNFRMSSTVVVHLLLKRSFIIQTVTAHWNIQTGMQKGDK